MLERSWWSVRLESVRVIAQALKKSVSHRHGVTLATPGERRSFFVLKAKWISNSCCQRAFFTSLKRHGPRECSHVGSDAIPDTLPLSWLASAGIPGDTARTAHHTYAETCWDMLSQTCCAIDWPRLYPLAAASEALYNVWFGTDCQHVHEMKLPCHQG